MRVSWLATGLSGLLFLFCVHERWAGDASNSGQATVRAGPAVKSVRAAGTNVDQSDILDIAPEASANP